MPCLSETANSVTGPFFWLSAISGEATNLPLIVNFIMSIILKVD